MPKDIFFEQLASRVAAIQPTHANIFARAGEYIKSTKITAETLLNAAMNTKGNCQAAYLNNLNILLDAVQKST